MNSLLVQSADKPSASTAVASKSRNRTLLAKWLVENDRLVCR